MHADILPVISATASIEIMDGVACAFLAAAASCRARSFGGNLVGAIALGCICGIIAPLCRETFLHGSPGSRLIIAALPDNAFIGALAGIFAPIIWPNRKGMIFFWLDSLGTGLAASLTTVLTLPELGIAAAIILGMCAALLPGLCRDVALGDIAIFVETNWYAASVATGCILALVALVAISASARETPLHNRAGELATLAGLMVVLALRFWKCRNMDE